MNKIKHLLTLAFAFLAFMPALAQNTISVDPVNIGSDGVCSIPVYLTNTDAIVGAQMDVTLPDFLEFDGTPVKNEARYDYDQTLQFNEKIGRILIASWSNEPFKGNEGEIFSIPVKVKEGTPMDSEGEITFSTVVLSGPAEGIGRSPKYELADFSVAVTYKAAEVAYTAEPSALSIEPGKQAQFSLKVSGNTTFYGMQATFKLPEGLKMEREITYGEILNTQPMIRLTPNSDNRFTIVYLDRGGKPTSANEGTFCTITVTASEDYALETGEIEVTNIQTSYSPGKDCVTPAFTIAVTNPSAAYSRLKEQIAVAQASLDQALAAIAEDYPAVADQFPGTEVAEMINALDAKIDAAYQDGTIMEQEEALMAEFEPISDAIGKLVSDADSAFVAQASNEAAYKQLTEQVATARQSLADAMSALAEDYADVASQYSDEEITAKITAVEEEVNAAYEAGTCVANYDEISAKISAIGEDLEALQAAASAAQQAFNSNKAAYNTLTELIATLRSTLADTMNSIAEDCPAVADKYSDEEIAAKINAVEANVNASNEASTCAEDYETLEAEIMAVVTDIEALKADAVAAQEAYNSNEAAYKLLNEQIATARQSLADTMDAIAEDCPAVADLFSDEEITAKIDAIVTEINAAREAGTCVEEFEAIAAKISALAEDLEALHTAAINAQQVSNANDAAYKGLNDLLDMARQSLTDTLDDIKENCPDVADQFPGTEISEKIDAIAAKVSAAHEAGTCVEDMDALEAEIKALATDLEKLTTDAYEAERQHKHVSANQAAYDELMGLANIATKTLADTMQAIAEDCPDVADQFSDAEIAQKIDDVKAEIEASFEAGTCEMDKEELTAKIMAIATDLENLKADAVNAQMAATSNKAAYNALMELIGVARQSLSDMMQAIAEDCPDVADQFSDAEIAAKIDAAEADVNAANEAATCVDDYDVLEAKIIEIGSDLEDLHSAAVNAQQAANSNKAAYKGINDLLDIARQSLADMMDAIAEDDPDVADKFSDAEIAGKIADLQAEADASYAAGTCVDDYDELTAKIQALGEDLEALKADAETAQQLVNSNKAAFAITEEQIDALQEKLDAMKANVAENYPDAPVSSYIYTAQSAIDRVRNDAEAALDNANDKLTQYEFTFDADQIEILVNEIELAAKSLGISDSLIQGVDGSSMCDVYSITGSLALTNVRVDEVRGMLGSGIYIVKVNGTAYKIVIR